MLPLKPFYMIRHGETVANAARIAAGGQLDSPLNETGISQARNLAPYMDQLEVKPKVIFHSNMQRARDTAGYLNDALGLDMIERADLREHELGKWDGQPWLDVLPRLENKETPDGGESESRFANRVQTAITDVLKENKDEKNPPLIVSHGGLFHAMGFLYEYGISPIRNCHLHYFEPHPECALFPWIVWSFDLEGDTLLKSPAPFCSSQTRAA